ncbi:MAG: retropepsin-like domain-containing protein [Flavobacteriales bacterium]|nr:retropepsin-like domain-containing protein [Flavobacteriales bacterium]MBP6696463.1 retropepsin-like domain-containing protein [Flavobacteriales bacterium]
MFHLGSVWKNYILIAGRTLLRNKFFAPLLIACMAFAVPNTLRANMGRVTLIREHGLFYIDVILRDDTLTALFDTGAEVSAIDPMTARRAGLATMDSVDVEGTNTTFRTARAAVAGCSLGGTFLHTVLATVRDLSFALAPTGRRLDLIAGNDLFAGRTVDLDLVAGTFTLHRTTPMIEGALAVPFATDHGIPRMAGTIDDTPVDLRLDTGASLFATPDLYVNIPLSLWERLRGADTTLTADRHLTATGIDATPVELPVARVGRCTIGAFDSAVDGTVVHVIVQPAAGYFARPDAVGFVSNNWLLRFHRVLIDLAGHQLFLCS